MYVYVRGAAWDRKYAQAVTNLVWRNLSRKLFATNTAQWQADEQLLFREAFLQNGCPENHCRRCFCFWWRR